MPEFSLKHVVISGVLNHSVLRPAFNFDVVILITQISFDLLTTIYHSGEAELGTTMYYACE